MAVSRTTTITELADLPEAGFIDVHRENAEARIRETGPGVELVRQYYIEQLRAYMNAFYEHGSFPDVVALCRALEMSEQVRAGSWHHAPIVESFLGMLGKKN